MRDRAFRRAQKSKDKQVKLCSCWLCGNARKYLKGHDKLTMQERKMNESDIQRHTELEDI